MAVKIILFFVLTLIFSIDIWAKNGSSGIGTAKIVKGFSANNLAGSVERVGDTIIDSKTKEKILDIIKLKKYEINFNNLNKAQFGKVSGFEYLPHSQREKNYWVLCKQNEITCFKLIPTSETNKKISSILGSLIEINIE